MAAEIDIAIFEWQTRRRHPKTASETSRVLEGAIPKLQAKHLELRWHPKTVSSGCN